MKTSLVNITEASKLAGVSRTYLYKKYINTGTLSVTKDERGHKVIDVSELIRVFGKLKGVNDDSNEIAPNDTTDNSILQQKIELLQEQIKLKDAIIQSQQANLVDLRQSLKLLEHKKKKKKVK